MKSLARPRPLPRAVGGAGSACNRVRGATGMVERMAEGKPGYRVQLPEMVHPISAGVKGGLLGGLVMPIPALIYSVLTGHGIWYPVNLLAGMALPGMQNLSLAELERFHFPVSDRGGIHPRGNVARGRSALWRATADAPAHSKRMAWGGLLMPVLWTGISFAAISIMNPDFYRRLDWPSFIFCAVHLRSRRGCDRRGVRGARRVGGRTLWRESSAGRSWSSRPPLWGWLTGHGIWYPVNLLAAMIMPRIAELPTADLEQFRGDWLCMRWPMHAVLSIAFGIALGLVSPRLPEIPAAMSWGALLMPVLWTAFEL